MAQQIKTFKEELTVTQQVFDLIEPFNEVQQARILKTVGTVLAENTGQKVGAFGRREAKEATA